MDNSSSSFDSSNKHNDSLLILICVLLMVANWSKIEIKMSHWWDHTVIPALDALFYYLWVSFVFSLGLWLSHYLLLKTYSYFKNRYLNIKNQISDLNVQVEKLRNSQRSISSELGHLQTKLQTLTTQLELKAVSVVPASEKTDPKTESLQTQIQSC